ncbi:MAG: serine hydrolase, partial [Muribaculaceae bacterium]|nr:serine hydrolase [Muribaculaceae bacterium]
HDKWVDENIFNPIGASTLCYRPLSRFSTDRIAATENDVFLRRQTIHGYVHDELAAFSGGIQGNAGLFGTATDVAKVCQMYLDGGTYGGTRILGDHTVKEFTTTQSPTCRRGLGFDRPDINDPDRSPVPEEVPQSAYGHTGFTGTCFWVDPDNDLIYVFLSNRINPSRENQAWLRNKARSRIHSLIYKALQ